MYPFASAMAGRKPLKVVSRVHEPRGNKHGHATFPALRISGKWLEKYCAIGDHYRLIQTERDDEIVIQFIRREAA